MNTLAFRSTAPAGAATMLTACMAVAACILFIDFPALDISWGFLSLTALLICCVWTPVWRPKVTWTRVDQLVWALLIGHTIQFLPGRDPRILVRDQSMTTSIMIQVVIWSFCLLYAGIRLLATSRRLGTLFGPGGKYATLFLVAATASSLYAVSIAITLAWSFKLLAIVLTGCLLFDSRDPEGSARRFVEATWLGLILLLVLFLVAGTIAPEMATGISTVGNVWRLGGALMPSTKLSAVAGLVALLALIDLLAGRATRFTRILLVLSSGMMVASLGRGGMLATGMSIMIVLMLFRRMKQAVYLGGLVCLVFLVVPGAADASWEVLSRRQGLGEIASLTGRVPLWETTLELISETPFLGLGYVSGSRIALVNSSQAWQATDAHNAFLQILLTLGIVGLTLIVAIFMKVHLGLRQILRDAWDPARPNERGIVGLKLLAFAVFLLVQGLLESGVSGGPNFETAILIGCAFSVDSLRRTS